MSNIYIQEPPSVGKVLLTTSVGEIDVELWSKEAPKACRNFVQLCMEGYYNGTIFHRVVRGFIVQGGDPQGTGEGGDSIYGEPFKDEIHSRLRFNRRGLVAMANAGKDDNGSQFFFTLGATPELQGKHTIFGKVAGDTIYNMIKLDAETDHDERPLHCHKIIKTEILNNPFPDIVPRVVQRQSKKEKKKEKEKGVKNLKLLSFGEEAEEDEEESSEFRRSTKIKSSHDVLNDPKLSKSSVDIVSEPGPSNELENNRHHEEEKLPSDKEEEIDLVGAKERELLRRRAEIQRQIDELKDDYRNRKKPAKVDETETKPQDEKIEEDDNELVEEYKSNLVKYSEAKTKLPLKGSDRESFTLQMLSKFKNKLQKVKDSVENEDQAGKPASDEDVNDGYDGNDGSWMSHTLKFTEKKPVLAKDASTKSDDWYDITDPRNPLVKRRREESEKSLSKHNKRMRD